VARSRLLLAAALAHRHLEAQASVDPLRVLQERSGPHCGTRMRGEGRGPHPRNGRMVSGGDRVSKGCSGARGRPATSWTPTSESVPTCVTV